MITNKKTPDDPDGEAVLTELLLSRLGRTLNHPNVDVAADSGR